MTWKELAIKLAANLRKLADAANHRLDMEAAYWQAKDTLEAFDAALSGEETP